MRRYLTISFVLLCDGLLLYLINIDDSDKALTKTARKKLFAYWAQAPTDDTIQNQNLFIQPTDWVVRTEVRTQRVAVQRPGNPHINANNASFSKLFLNI